MCEVSIIIPVYNVETYIENCLRSVAAQTCQDFEVVIVDDGSTDNSIEVAERYLSTCARVNDKIVRQKNAGPGKARNHGLSEAGSTWVMFLDSDDILQPNAVKLLLDAAQKYKADMIFGDFQMVEPGGTCKPISYNKGAKRFKSEEIQRLFLERKKRVLVPGTLYKKEWLESNELYFDSLRFSEDQHFLWRALLHANCVVNVQTPLYNYLVRKNSIMTSSGVDEIVQAYEKMKALSVVLWESGTAIPSVKKWFLSRWTLGALRAGAKMLDWHSFQQVARSVSYQKHCKDLKGFPDKRVGIIAFLALFNLRFYYTIFHRIG